MNKLIQFVIFSQYLIKYHILRLFSFTINFCPIISIGRSVDVFIITDSDKNPITETNVIKIVTGSRL